MTLLPDHIRLVAPSMAVSVFLHVMVLSVLTWFAPHNFTAPIASDSHVNVDLKSSYLPTDSRQGEIIAHPSKRAPRFVGSDKPVHNNLVTQDFEKIATVPSAVSGNSDSRLVSSVALPATAAEPVNTGSDLLSETAPPLTDREAAAIIVDPPLRTASEFLANDNEKLSYIISLLGIPVGSAILEAKKENNEVRISLRVNSNPVIASIYPVDDLIETRHIGGNFILSKIRQQEGAFKSDRGFTIFLRDKNVFWIDRLTNRSVWEPIPNSDVVDLLSGFYYLRNRALKTGTTETVQIYDSDTYTEVPVDILRREKIVLPGLRQLDTLVIQPKLKTEGIFRRTGGVLIWLTDDQYRVPVKFVTSIALGQVTAELVSSDIQR